MNEYTIEHKINTLSYLLEDVVDYGEFQFRDWNPTKDAGITERGWVAKKNMRASDLQSAINTFRSEIAPIVDRIALASQCYAAFEWESFCATRLNDNRENIFFFWHSTERAATSLYFGEDQKTALKKLEVLDRQHALQYIRESSNAMSVYTRLAMLLSSLEALAGEVTGKGGEKRANKERMRDEILGGDQVLFDEIMKYGEGIRNKLFHGVQIDLNSYPDIVARIYSKIVEYFNREFDLKINRRVVNPPRTPFGNYELKRLWLKPTPGKSIKDICLKSLAEDFSKNESPPEYSFVEPPDRY